MQRDSLGGTFAVAGVLCVICSLMVSAAAVGLRSKQQENKEVDRKKNILIAAGLCDKGASSSQVDAIFEEQVRETLVDLSTGKPVAEGVVDPKTYDARKAAKDPALSQPIEGGALPGISNREKYARVYETVNGDEVTGYIFPIYGKGLWSTLYGFIALQADGQTVRGITFYEHAETPGLGGEVDNEGWKASWQGKIALEGGEVQIQVLKGKAVTDSPRYNSQIDGLSGATITTKGVNNLVRYWLGDDGFGPFLAAQSGAGHQDHDEPGHDHDGHDDHSDDDHEEPKTAHQLEGISRG